MATPQTIYTALVCLMASIGMLACRSSKETRSATFRQDAISDVYALLYARQQQARVDSVQQLWSFYSDSAFAFHPDTGLRALSGYLLFNQMALHAQQSRYATDAEVTTSHADALSYRAKQHSREAIRPWVWVVTFLALLLLGYLFIRRLPWPFRLL